MPQSATAGIRFAGPAALPLEASFDGGRLTSDGGLPWLSEAEAVLGLCGRLAAVVPEWRRRAGSVRHSRLAALPASPGSGGAITLYSDQYSRVSSPAPAGPARPGAGRPG